MNPYRLPGQVKPRRYELRLATDLTNGIFTGEVSITLKVEEPTAEVVCNAAELTIEEAAIEGESGIKMPATVTLQPQEERCRLTFPSRLQPGTCRLNLRFRGQLSDKLRGFYRSTFKEETGGTSVLAATQFEATDARRAFPCWDEPSFKAVFALTLVIPPELTALSNSSPVEEMIVGNQKWVRFADTIAMSTYLVAWVIGPLEGTEPVLVGKTPLQVWCTPGKKRLTAFAEKIGAFSLRFFEDYYGLPYPGDKLDLIAIPDFAAGAMENLGAITFRETALLVDEKAATHAELERVADVVAHEIAHMWFGDLVTMTWWNGLWLNEAFATFLEMVAVDAWKPQWQRWTTFGASRAAALVVDGLHSTRPIEYPVAAPRDAEAMFDVLTYEKGASVLRMLEQFLGTEVFRAGVRLYLQRHALANTDTGDLWKALGEVSKHPIPAIMDDWVFQPGYPLLEVRQKGTDLILRQRRFLYLPEPLPGEEPSSPSEITWQVPVQLCFLIGDKGDRPLEARGGSPLVGQRISRRLLLGAGPVHLPVPEGFDSVLLNEGGQGFFRVHYSPDLHEGLLAGGLDRLAAIERFNLVNDAWAAVLAGLMSVVDFLDFTARFRQERDRNVWTVLSAALAALNRMIEIDDRPGLEKLVRDRAGSLATGLGWQPRPGEDELTRQLRGDLLRLMGVLGNDHQFQAEAAGLFQAHQADPARVDANVWAAVVAIMGHTGDAGRYQDFLARFQAARTPQEEQRFLYALAAFQPADLVQHTLALTLNGRVRTQDAPLLLRAMLQSVTGQESAWAFIQEKWEEMQKKFPFTGIRRMLEGTIGLVRLDWERQVHVFFTKNRIDLGGKTKEQYLEQLRMAVSLREREGVSLRNYLRSS